MTDTTVIDPAGVPRTEAGEITTPPASESTPATPATPPSTNGATILNEAAPEAPKPAEGAPDKYADYKLPDGFEIVPEIRTEADSLFKGMGLSQDNAQKLVDFYVKQTTDAQNAPYKAYQDMTANWRSQTEAHPDLAGKLGPGKEVNTTISRALDSLGDPALSREFREVMDLTGVGNHPAFVRAFFRLAQRVTEGSHVAGNRPSPGGQSAPGQAPRSTAQTLWPNLPSAMNP